MDKRAFLLLAAIWNMTLKMFVKDRYFKYLLCPILCNGDPRKVIFKEQLFENDL